MSQYHINKKGEGRKCDAKKGGCPFGVDTPHFDTKEEAQEAYEQKQKDKAVGGISYTPMPHWVNESLNEDDLNDFEDRWNEYFESVKKVEGIPHNIDPDSLLNEPLYPERLRGIFLTKIDDDEVPEAVTNLAKGEYVVEMHCRQGGGNRECYCESESEHEDGCLAQDNDLLMARDDYLYDEDDDWDQTYAVFYFDNNITKEKKENFYEEKRRRSSEREKKTVYQKIEQGEVPPWAINDNFDWETMNRYIQNKVWLERETEYSQRDEIKTKHEKIKNLVQKSSEEKLDYEDLPKSLPEATKNRMLEVNHSYISASEELQEVDRIDEEVKNLPEGSLRDYLIKNNSFGISDFAIKKREAKRAYESKKNSLNVIMLPFRGNLESDAKAKKELRKRKKATNLLRGWAWASGWNGKTTSLPKPPKNF